MKDFETAVETQVAAQKSRPVILVEMSLDAGTLRYAATNQNLIFPTGGNTYTAKAMKAGNIQTGRGNQIITCELSMDNVKGDMHGYNAAERFDGRSIEIMKVYRDALGGALYYNELIKGFMTEPKFDKTWCIIPCIMGKALQRRLLLEYYATACQNIFGGYLCNYNGYADLTTLKKTSTVTTASAAYIYDSTFSQAADYWKYGRVKITISGVAYYRRIVGYSLTYKRAELDVPMHTDIPIGSAYTIYKGCPKTLEACKHTYAYGPSANNQANFKGYIHIGKYLDTSKSRFPYSEAIDAFINNGERVPYSAVIDAFTNPSGGSGGWDIPGSFGGMTAGDLLSGIVSGTWTKPD